ncbi:Predicted nucleic acid-binding protein, contains PIN domain [Roseateles sp. YR242]|uniref:PIN domain-containing protein n=1 Tax=Roseateles sp. YR242 TaxID=1855305 RepID=UPI0008B1A52C|nr:PIN domain-containing protein [Roseateles sp. YR242]SEK61142.1 Predicted nucleic acid-binding protein, contains PIN domain [Roseateles sp. YR242]
MTAALPAVALASPVFVDTSVLIQSEDGAFPDRREQVMAWLRVLWQQRLGRVSSQVLNEFYRTITTRIQPPMPNGDARAEVRRYQRWAPWAVDHATVESAWSLESRFNLPYTDALIVAAAKVQGCELLLSLTLPHQQLFDSVTIINPLLAAPAGVPATTSAERSA